MKYKVGKHAVISFQQQQRVVVRHIPQENWVTSRSFWLWLETWPYGGNVVFGGGDAERHAD